MKTLPLSRNRKLVRAPSGLWWVTRNPELFIPPIAGGGSFSTTETNLQLTNFGTRNVFVGANSAFPGDTGASELSGVPYARQAVTWGAASGKSIAASNSPAIPIPAGATVAFLTTWTLVTLGVFGGWAARAGGVPGPFEAAAATDVFTDDQNTLADGDQIILLDTTNAVLPTGTGIAEGTILYVRDKTTDTFKVALTSGGAAVDITADGAGFVQKLTTQTYSTGGTETVSSLVFDSLR